MASTPPLKRKRAPVETMDMPKRAKSVKKSKPEGALGKLENRVGWDAAFDPKGVKEVVKVNGVNGHHEVNREVLEDVSGSLQKKFTPKSKGSKHLRTGLASPEAVDYETFISKDYQDGAKGMEVAKKALMKAARKREGASWKLSEPVGGRMIDADPVFSVDEKFLIVANTTHVLVYSASNSLFIRSIKLQVNKDHSPAPRIITYSLSATQSNILWVACSDGSIFSVDWTTGAGADQFWGVSSTGCIHMTVSSMVSAGRRRDIVFTTESRKDGGFRITANELAAPNSSIKTVARTIYTTENRIQILKASKDGSILVGASCNRILLGRLRNTEYDTVDKIRYEFRVFESSDAIKSLDLRVSARSGVDSLWKAHPLKNAPVVDLVVGDVRGVVFIHNDLLGKLIQSQSGDATLPAINYVPRKLHWHRQAVHTAKFSPDGNYIITGGTETVLVLWQLDTGHRQFLPHMTATIQNVVVSPSGTSYGIQLGDNSAMILSTAELTPTANISGIQASVVVAPIPEELNVKRLEAPSWDQPLVQHTPAVINPALPSRLLLNVGSEQEIRAVNQLKTSTPYLQTFDLGNSHNFARQALTRTNITNINISPGSFPLSEPRVTHMKISHDGKWLVTVDEWTPPVLDLELLSTDPEQLHQEQLRRREVFLKFWSWQAEGETWELVSRVDAPHSVGLTSGDAARVFDLALDPSSLRFATIGEDGVARVWASKARKRDGVFVRGKDGIPLRNWNCEHAILLGKSELLDYGSGSVEIPTTGSIAFSEDGSILAASIDNSEGLLHLLDPESGVIRMSHSGLYEGQLIKLDFLGQDLIALSDTLSVFDIVAEETRLAFKLSMHVTNLSTVQKQEMFHLAIDRHSHTFAIALPNLTKKLGPSLENATSELMVFNQSLDMLISEQYPNIITSLLPALSSPGYLTLDTSALIRTISRKGIQSITSQAQSTSALNLGSSPEDEITDIMQLVDEVEDISDEQLLTPAPTVDGTEEEGEGEEGVVSQEMLRGILDQGPAFAGPSLEEMFWGVMGLCGGKAEKV